MTLWIGNVVFDVPATDPDAAGLVADLYAELLGLRRCSRADLYREAGYPADEGDEQDPLARTTVRGLPGIAFEWEADYGPVRWPDSAHPQQLHLDVAVADLDAGVAIVERHGGSLLRDAGTHRVCADAVGHPLCLVPQGGEVGRIERVVLDGPDPAAMAAFWHGLLGDHAGPALAFQQSDAEPPRWPDPAHPQQVHLDLDADTLDEVQAAQTRIEALGGAHLPYLGGDFVFADPAGHPFCCGEP